MVFFKAIEQKTDAHSSIRNIYMQNTAFSHHEFLLRFIIALWHICLKRDSREMTLSLVSIVVADRMHKRQTAFSLAFSLSQSSAEILSLLSSWILDFEVYRIIVAFQQNHFGTWTILAHINAIGVLNTIDLKKSWSFHCRYVSLIKNHCIFLELMHISLWRNDPWRHSALTFLQKNNSYLETLFFSFFLEMVL